MIHVDHIKPRSKYPKLALDQSNLQPLCETCNLKKGDKVMKSGFIAKTLVLILILGLAASNPLVRYSALDAIEDIINRYGLITVDECEKSVNP